LSFIRRKTFTAFCLLCLSASLWAQGSGRLPTRNFGVEQGLTNLSVYALVQDDAHTIWAGTEAGIFRFDGQRFRSLDLALPSNFVQALLPEANGGLWIATRGGLARWDSRPGSKPKPAEGVPEISVTHLARGSGNQIWALTPQGPLVSVDNRPFSPPQGWPRSEQGNALFAWPDSPSVLVASSRKIWMREDPGESTWHVQDLPLKHPREALVAVAQDGQGTAWARSDRSLYRRLATEKVRKQGASPPPGEATDAPSLCRDRESRGWISVQLGLRRPLGPDLRAVGLVRGLGRHHRGPPPPLPVPVPNPRPPTWRSEICPEPCWWRDRPSACGIPRSHPFPAS